jgi:hypothetical protein
MRAVQALAILLAVHHALARTDLTLMCEGESAEGAAVHACLFAWDGSLVRQIGGLNASICPQTVAPAAVCNATVQCRYAAWMSVTGACEATGLAQARVPFAFGGPNCTVQRRTLPCSVDGRATGDALVGGVLVAVNACACACLGVALWRRPPEALLLDLDLGPDLPPRRVGLAA